MKSGTSRENSRAVSKPSMYQHIQGPRDNGEVGGTNTCIGTRRVVSNSSSGSSSGIQKSPRKKTKRSHGGLPETPLHVERSSSPTTTPHHRGDIAGREGEEKEELGGGHLKDSNSDEDGEDEDDDDDNVDDDDDSEDDDDGDGDDDEDGDDDGNNDREEEANGKEARVPAADPHDESSQSESDSEVSSPSEEATILGGLLNNQYFLSPATRSTTPQAENIHGSSNTPNLAVVPPLRNPELYWKLRMNLDANMNTGEEDRKMERILHAERPREKPSLGNLQNLLVQVKQAIEDLELADLPRLKKQFE
ncbi:hypothetical protein FRC00_009298 [Tulasnella sp. 408]|nr:hypothetical protein FRC00_009298 [Tulasnella sp. 408]